MREIVDFQSNEIDQDSSHPVDAVSNLTLPCAIIINFVVCHY